MLTHYRQIPVSSRIPFLYVDKGRLEKKGHALIVTQGEEEISLPVSNMTAIFLQPGTSITHAAVKLCGEVGCILLWTGDDGVRLYSFSNPKRNSHNLLQQAKLHLSPSDRLNVSRRIFELMFDEKAPKNRSIEQLRGLEGSKVRKLYKNIAKENDCPWTGRSVGPNCGDLNSCISYANATVYGLVEAVVIALGFSSSIGFTHSGGSRSFVYDVADCIKFKTVVPLAFQVYMEKHQNYSREVRLRCGAYFRRKMVAGQIVTILDTLFAKCI